MKRLLTATALALLTTTAHAEDRREMYRSGYWVVQHIFSTPQYPDMCVMSGIWKYQQNNIAVMTMVKWTPVKKTFLHTMKSNWKLPVGIDVKMDWEFKNGSRPAGGTTIETTDGANNIIETSISDDNALAILWDFASTNTLKVTFKTGNEKPWSLAMDGSRGAAASFSTCVKALADAAGVKSPFVGTNTSPVAPGPQASSPTSPVNPRDPQTPRTVPTSPVKRDNGSI